MTDRPATAAEAWAGLQAGDMSAARSYLAQGAEPRYDTPEARAEAEAAWFEPSPEHEATLAEPHPERYSFEAAVNGDYPGLCNDLDCKPCEASEAAWSQEEAVRREHEAEAG